MLRPSSAKSIVLDLRDFLTKPKNFQDAAMLLTGIQHY